MIDSTTSLGSLCQCLTTLLENMFPNIQPDPSSGAAWGHHISSYHYPITVTWEQRSTPTLLQPLFKALQRAMRSPLSLHFSRLNHPSPSITCNDEISLQPLKSVLRSLITSISTCRSRDGTFLLLVAKVTGSSQSSSLCFTKVSLFEGNYYYFNYYNLIIIGIKICQLLSGTELNLDAEIPDHRQPKAFKGWHFFFPVLDGALSTSIKL